MTIREQIQRITDLIEFIEIGLPELAETVLAKDLAALVSDRVIQDGENYLGGSFKPYSTKTVAAFRFWGKSRTQAAERKVRERSRARGAMSYTEFRNINNLNTGKKNFEFTGEMWRKFGPVKTVKQEGGFKTSIGGTTEDAQRKIDENSAAEGYSIIEANDEEREVSEEGAAQWLIFNSNRILNDE